MTDLKTVEIDRIVSDAPSGKPLSSPFLPSVGRRARPPAARTQAAHSLPRLLSDQVKAGIIRSRPLLHEELAHGRLFLLSPLALILGAVIWFVAEVDITAWTMVACAAPFTLLLFAAGPARPVARAVAVAGLLVTAGMACAAWQSFRADTTVLDVAVTTTVTGRVEERESTGPGRWRYIIALEATEAPTLSRFPQRISLVSRGSVQPIAIGARLKGKARLTPPSGPALPGLNDFTFASYFDGIGANGFFYGMPDFIAADAASRDGIADRAFQTLARIRSDISDRIRTILPGDAGAFAASLVTDERRAISKETTDALRVAGLTHIVAISGLNMALSAGIFFIGLRYLLSLSPRIVHAYPTKKWAAAGAMLALCAYYLICGFAVSAERAFIMMAVMLMAVLVDRPSISLRNVAISAIIIVVLSPSEALGPSFQMSYAATLALVASYALWTRRPAKPGVFAQLPFAKPLSIIAKIIGGILFSSLIGGFSTALFAAEHFHRLTAYGLPANLLAMPIVSFVVMPFGTLAMLLMPFGLDAWCWWIVGFGLDMVISIAKMVAGWGGTYDIGRFPSWYFAAAVAGFLLLTLLRTRLRWSGAVIIGLSSLCLALVPSTPQSDLFIAEDGGLIGIRDGNLIATNRGRPPDFIFGQWQHALMLADHKPPKLVKPAVTNKLERGARLSAEEQAATQGAMRRALLGLPENAFACAGGAWCTARLDSGYVITTIESPAYLGPACDASDIVVIAAKIRLTACRSGSLLFTGQTLRRTGAVEIRINDDGEPVVTASFENGLRRPWMRHRTYDWRSGSYDEPTSPLSDSGE